LSEETAPEVPDLDTVPPARPAPSRKTLTLILAPVIVVFVIGTIGNMIHPTLLVNAPLLLVAMEPRFRYMLLVAPRVDLLPFMILVLIRRLISDPFLFALGRLYGDSGVRWMERQMQDTIGWVRKLERGFGKAAWIFVLLWPGFVVCLLAGATGMRFATFMILNVIGTVATSYLAYAASDLVSTPVNWVNNLYAGNQKLFLIISVISFGLMFATRRMQGKGEPLTVKEVERVLNEEGAQPREDRGSSDT
jgi:membrane protein DedA with SNARE-associated domain